MLKLLLAILIGASGLNIGCKKHQELKEIVKDPKVDILHTGCTKTIQPTELTEEEEQAALENLSTIFLELNKTESLDKALGMEIYNPGSVLEMIDPALTTENLCLVNYHQYELFILPQMPDWLTQRIQTRIEESGFGASGWGLFDPTAWSEIAKLQKELIIGFKGAEKDRDPVNGIYIHKGHAMMLSTSFILPTLLHEVRHYEQHKELEKIKPPYYYYPSISRRCLEDMRWFFSELDAETTGIAAWRDILSRIDIPENQNQKLNPLQETYSESGLMLGAYFQSEFNYPSSILRRIIKKRTCYGDNLALLRRLAEVGSRGAIDDYSDTVQSRYSRILTSLKKYVQLSQSEQGQQCAEAEKVTTACLVLKDYLLVAQEEYAAILKEYQAMQESRIQEIEEIIGTMDERLQKDLCTTSGAFRLMTNCLQERE